MGKVSYKKKVAIKENIFMTKIVFRFVGQGATPNLKLKLLVFRIEYFGTTNSGKVPVGIKKKSFPPKMVAIKGCHLKNMI